MNTKEIGLMGRYDLLVLDEGQSINFKGADDIQAKFKDYLESGHYSIGNDKITSECGLIVFANIDLFENKPRQNDYIRHLPQMFQESALIESMQLKVFVLKQMCLVNTCINFVSSVTLNFHLVNVQH